MLLPALLTVIMLAITVGLGTWQLQRLAWKTALLAEIDRGEAMAPIGLLDRPEAFRKVSVSGTFLPVTARYGAELRPLPTGALIGSQVLGVLQRPGAAPILVDRGWAPGNVVVPSPDGAVQLVGYIRPPDHASWTSVSDTPAQRLFYTLDPLVIGNVLGQPDVAPYTLVVLGPAAPGIYPDPAATLPRPPNDHLTYAITWFGLAAALLAVFAVYVRQALRERRVQA